MSDISFDRLWDLATEALVSKYKITHRDDIADMRDTVEEVLNAIWPEIKRQQKRLDLAQYDANRCFEFQGYRDKVLLFWAKRAITAEKQLEEAGIERIVVE